MESHWLFKTSLVLWNFVELNPFAYIALAAWFLFSSVYVIRAFRSYDKISPYLLQSIPFVFTTLGLLGTVSGCLIFSWGYKPLDFLAGVQTLFKGVMSSGVTTLVGIIMSIVFGKIINLTEIKHASKKAIENTELAVLKKMLRLLVADYERSDTFQDNELMAIDGVRDAIFYAYPKLLKRLDGLKKTAMTESGQGLATLVENLAADLRSQAAAMVQSQEKQAAHLEALHRTLAGTGENSLLGQLRALRSEQAATGKANFGKLGEAVAKFSAIDMRPLAASFDASLKKSTQTLLEEMKVQTSHVTQATALAATYQSKLDALQQAVQGADQSGLLFEIKDLQARQVLSAERAEERSESSSAALQAALRRTKDQVVASVAENLDGLRGVVEAQDAMLTGIAGFCATEAPEKIIGPLQQLQHSQMSSFARVEETTDAVRDALATQGQEVEKRVVLAMESVAKTQAKGLLSTIQDLLAAYGGKVRGQLERMEIMTEREAAAGLKITQELDARHSDAVTRATKQTESLATSLRDEIRSLTDRVEQSTARIQNLAAASETLLTDNVRIKTLIAEMAALSDTDKTLQAILQKVDAMALPTASNGSNGKHAAKLQEALLAGEPLGRSVEKLISRLREIEDIRSTDGKFWKQVQKQINDGIPIIMGGNKLQFREGIDLDGEFQDRLNRSFVNLDKILQTIVDGYHKKSNGLPLRN